MILIMHSNTQLKKSIEAHRIKKNNEKNIYKKRMYKMPKSGEDDKFMNKIGKIKLSLRKLCI